MREGVGEGGGEGRDEVEDSSGMACAIIGTSFLGEHLNLRRLPCISWRKGSSAPSHMYFSL